MIANNFYFLLVTTNRSAGLMKLEAPVTPEIKDAILNRPGAALPVKSSQTGAVAYECNTEWDYDLALFNQLQDLLLAGAPFAIEFAENGSTASSTNRLWSGTATISGGLMATGAVGDRKKIAVKFVNTSNDGWSFTITP